MESALQIIKVEDRKARDTFIRLPWSIYKDDPQWVPPLLLERHMYLSPKSPYFEHAECCLWIAFRDGQPVGRISAQVDRLHLEHHQDDTGFWGMLEAEDNIDTFQRLFSTAESWLCSRGMKRARGPFSLSINQECGLLINGFDTPPSMMMGHSRPYYAEHIEQCGYDKEKDLLAYMIHTDVEPSNTKKTIIKKTQKRIHTRTLRKSHFNEDLDIVFSIFNDAWADNWGFVPFTEKEFSHLAKDLKLLINEQFVRIAYVDGIPAAFIVLLPNLNEVIQDLNGSLFPFGWLKILWRLKVKYPQTGRISLMGVLSKYQDSLLGAALAYRVIADTEEAIISRGLKEIELSWILEDNVGVQDIIEDFGGQVYKTYRIYSKEL
ncbi:MAG: N-acetyltransferase [Desulfobulbaceae bacterium]|nr:N-acetyltransferase [Desulfobulbaceae bacterium]